MNVVTTRWFSTLGWLLILLLTPLFVACYTEPPKPGDVGSFRVEFVGNPNLGDSKNPLPVATGKSPLTLRLKVTALSADGKEDKAYSGYLCIFSDRGLLVSSQRPREIKGGVIEEVLVRLFLAFGKTTIWLTSVPQNTLCPNATDPLDKSIPPVGKVGSAPALTFKLLSIRDVQAGTESPFNSPLFKKYAVVGSGKMVVTAVSSNGFHATDLAAYKDGGGFHSLFIFTFSAPTLAFEDGAVPRTLQVGDLVSRVEGGIDEFSGHTQMTFPTFVPTWKDKPGGPVAKIDPKDMPKPEKFSAGDTWSRGKMERYESALVEINNAIALPVIQTQDGWDQFRQWPVLLVEADKSKNQTQASCENWVRTELHLHDDPSKNGGEYRPCLGQCEGKRRAQQAKCQTSLTACKAKPGANQKKCEEDDRVCREEGNNIWFSCFFQCRFNRERKGILDRARKKGCSYAILLVQSSSTVPTYDPPDASNKNRRFPYIRGILQQVKAGAFFQILKTQTDKNKIDLSKQFDSEMSNNGFVIWVRQPSDLSITK